MLFIGPDWQEIYASKEAIEADFGNFKYEGPGWYLTEGDTLLIKEHPMGKLAVMCWNFSNARKEIADNMMELLLLPVRVNNVNE